MKAVGTAAEIMKALADATGPLSLTDLSALCGMAPSKAHRYLASMVDHEMVIHRRSGLYDLGPLAADIGLAALSRIDDVNHYSDLLPALVDRTGLTALLTVWTTYGPTVLRLERHDPTFRHAFSPGAPLQVLGNTVGGAFLYHLADRLTRPVLARELNHAPDCVDVDAHRQHPDADSLFRGPYPVTPVIHTVSRPMLDLHGEPRCVITITASAAEAVDITSDASAALLGV